SGQASISYLQRRLRIGFSRAARLVDMMEMEGLVSPAAGGKAREVLVDKSYFEEVDAQLRGFMVKRILALALPPATKAAVPPVRTMYNDALAREQAVRAALDAPDALATILIDVRTVVAAYEAVVKHYPASSYSDDALWNAGRLSIDAFVKFGQAQDKEA